MNLRFVTCIIFAPLCVHAEAYDSLLKRYERQIVQQSRQLKSLRARLSENDRDVLKWQRKAEDSRQLWVQTGQNADRARQKAEASREEWTRTRHLAESAQWDVATQTLLSRAAHDHLTHCARELYARHLTGQVKASVSWQERLPEFLAQGMMDVAHRATQEAMRAEQDEVRLRTQELKLKEFEQHRRDEWSRLRREQQVFWQKWQGALRRQEALREEKAQMEQSELALQVMLQNLRQDKERTRAARTGLVISDPALARLKGTLPWPAAGRVVQEFGRQQSSELQQLVVSNGIKIEAGAGRTVRAIQPGKVIFSAPFRSYGPLVIIQHKSGLTSVYAGLSDTTVQQGVELAALDAIGRVNDSGSFYFELRRDERPINPLAYLTPARQDISSRRTYP